MIGRWLATLAIVALLALDVVLPATPLGRRGDEATVRADVASAVLAPGDRWPEPELTDLEGRPIDWADLRGHRVLVTFERSVDW